MTKIKHKKLIENDDIPFDTEAYHDLVVKHAVEILAYATLDNIPASVRMKSDGGKVFLEPNFNAEQVPSRGFILENAGDVGRVLSLAVKGMVARMSNGRFPSLASAVNDLLFPEGKPHYIVDIRRNIASPMTDVLAVTDIEVVLYACRSFDEYFPGVYNEYQDLVWELTEAMMVHDGLTGEQIREMIVRHRGNLIGEFVRGFPIQIMNKEDPASRRAYAEV